MILSPLSLFSLPRGPFFYIITDLPWIFSLLFPLSLLFIITDQPIEKILPLPLFLLLHLLSLSFSLFYFSCSWASSTKAPLWSTLFWKCTCSFSPLFYLQFKPRGTCLPTCCSSSKRREKEEASMKKAGTTLKGAVAMVKLGSGGKGEKEASEVNEWEVRPGGMLVQRRDANEEPNLGPLIRLRVTHGLSLHTISVPSKTSFGDLKKLIAKECALHPTEQRLIYRGKERANSDYLNEVGAKNKSKIVLVEDLTVREKRLLEMRRDAENARASKAIADVKEEVDKLTKQVVKVKGIVLSGTKVPENDIVVLIEKFMCQLLKLDSAKSNGDSKAQRLLQIRRIQKHVESLDSLKERNATLKPTGAATKSATNALHNSTSATPKQQTSNALVTTKWESFESGPNNFAPPPTSTIAAITTGWELAIATDWEVFE